MSEKNLVIGNWKMNPASFDEAVRIARAARATAGKLSSTDVVVCPPFPFMAAAVSRARSANYAVGSQSVSTEESGPYTGEVGADMVRSLGASYAVVGHSEMRARGDTDAIVSKRILRAIGAGMTAVVCVGEKSRDEAGSHLGALHEQIRQTFAGLPADAARRIVIAYEPVWAIGAKEAMKPEDIYEMSLFVKKVFADIFGSDAGHRVRVLYGGSVNFRNAADIMKIGRVNGLLVGRESVNVPGFKDLLKAVDAV